MPGNSKSGKEYTENRLEFLFAEIGRQYSGSEAERIIEGLHAVRKSSFRINRLKTDADAVGAKLRELGIGYRNPGWFGDAFVLEETDEAAVRNDDIYGNGEIYFQNLSSMIPPLMTRIEESEDVLDMCAAPGSKTTQIVSLSEGRVNVTACEKDRIRAERLRYNLAKQGCSGVNVLNADARKLDSFLRFDRIFLDAPCSGSGTVLSAEPDTYRAFSEKLVHNSAALQLQLLRKGLSLLKKGGVLVYSTCSVLPEENEAVVMAAMRDGGIEIIPVPERLHDVPALHSRIPDTLLVCPGEEHEGFFAAILRKTG